MVNSDNTILFENFQTNSLNSQIMSYLATLSAEDKGAYYRVNCPLCGKHDAYCHKKSISSIGVYARITCNSKDTCGYSKTIAETFKISPAQAPNPAMKKMQEEAVTYWERHGLNPWDWQQNGLFESPSKFNVFRLVGGAPNVTLELAKPDEKGRRRWINVKGAVCAKKVTRYFLPPIHPGDTLYIVEGVWDWLMATEDGLPAIAGLWGATTKPRDEEDWGLMGNYPKIILVPHQDKNNTGQSHFATLGMFIKEKFPDKSVEMITLPFLPGGGKDYCDWRLRHSREDFLGLPSHPIDPKETKREKQKREREEKREAARRGTTSDTYLDEKGQVIPGEACAFFIQSQKHIIYAQEAFWIYEEGVWKSKNDKHVRKLIADMLGKKLATKNLIENIFYLTVAQTYRDGQIFNPDPNLLNFQNWMLDIYTDTVYPHNPEYMSNIQFPFPVPISEIRVAVKNNAMTEEMGQRLCPTWIKFLKSLQFDLPAIARLMEWSGYCLTRETRLERCLYLKGEGANGKSTFLEGIKSVIGELSSNLEIGQLFDKFKLAGIEGKIVNVSTDVDTSKVLESMFKKIVSGETLEVEKKHKPPYSFRPFAKFIFSANDFLPTRDRSHGFFRRFDIIEFKRIFEESEVDESIKETIKSGVEAQGIFLWMYFGLKRLIKRNWKMTNSEAFNETKREFEESANPLKLFIEEECVADPKKSEDAEKFRNKYVLWCEKRGQEALGDSKLGREMKRLGFANTRKRDEGGRLSHEYKGIKLSF